MSEHIDRRMDSPLIGWIVGLGITTIVSVFFILGRMRYGQDQLGFFADDFFYYSLVAKNIAFHGVSTFDGTTITNGYHPLWLTILVVLWRLGGEGHFLLLVLCTLIAACFATFSLTYALARHFGVTTPMALVGGLWSLGAFIVVAGGGMEGILAVPLVFLAMLFIVANDFDWNPTQCITLGFLLSLTILARLDTVLWVGSVIVFLVLTDHQPAKVWVTRMAYVIVGMPLLALYFVLNRIIFGQFGPISGTAKSLKRGFHFDPVGLYWSFGAITRGHFPSSQILLIAVLLIFFGLISFSRKKVRTLPRKQVAVLIAGLVFPLLHITALAFEGDWQLFFVWYYYTFVIADLCGLVVLCLAFQEQTITRFHPWVEISAISVVLICFLFGSSMKLRPGTSNYTYRAALHIEQFARTHPGRYAMGDRGAIVGYLLARLGDPMVQTEGIVMDKTFLARIRSQSDLLSTLRDYKVDYYIANNPTVVNNCYHLEEPAYAGSHSPKMRSVICEKPLAVFHDPGNEIFLIPRRDNRASEVGAGER